jgi:hypothetical protein
LYFPGGKIYQTPIKKSPVKYLKWTFEKDKALIEFISIIKIDPKYQYGTHVVGEWPSFNPLSCRASPLTSKIVWR